MKKLIVLLAAVLLLSIVLKVEAQSTSQKSIFVKNGNVYEKTITTVISTSISPKELRVAENVLDHEAQEFLNQNDSTLKLNNGSILYLVDSTQYLHGASILSENQNELDYIRGYTLVNETNQNKTYAPLRGVTEMSFYAMAGDTTGTSVQIGVAGQVQMLDLGGSQTDT